MYEHTLKKQTLLKQHSYHLKIMWECNWDREVNTNEALQRFLATYQKVDPLEPRNAFFGGRTNAVRLYHPVDQSQGEQIKYVDVTSLYSWVNKTCEYPVGHPEILTNPTDQDIHHYFGMAYIDILPPPHLYHPVLLHRPAGKLTFPLCRSCVQDQMPLLQLDKLWWCSHTETQHALRRTWCTPEIQEAVRHRYIVLHIHKMWHFPPKKRRKGLFSDYVNSWLKMKQESARYPGWCLTPNDKLHYVRQYKEREGIALDTAMIQKNPGRKATPKLMLNSFWGKLGENLHKKHTKTAPLPAELFGLVSNSFCDI